MAPIPEFITNDIDHISIYDVLEYVVLAYKSIVISHPYITGFLLIMWSYHPKAPFQALAYLLWTFPKQICIWILRSRGFRIGEVDDVQTDEFNEVIPVDSPFTRYHSYGAVNDGNTYHQVVDEVSLWWRLLGMVLYLFGFAVMLVYGSLIEG
ncbi:hypothetical protein BDN70DRAFT_685474 [Pholiota conissans]|uniref:Uncharacterized protein n=1 Tax=Pholiota conissans TaxID=109636 RepID=A0A9P5Z451_9AGAR|nr:hypothetical protein BDN70DRAFT_685474 [Pholiota conissans]